MTRNEIIRRFDLTNTVELQSKDLNELVNALGNEFKVKFYAYSKQTNTLTIAQFTQFISEYIDFFNGIANKAACPFESVWASLYAKTIAPLKNELFPEMLEKKNEIYNMTNFDLIKYLRDNGVYAESFKFATKPLSSGIKDEVLQHAISVYNGRLKTFEMRESGMTKEEIFYKKMSDKFAIAISKISETINYRVACNNLDIKTSDIVTVNLIESNTYKILSVKDINFTRIPHVIAASEFLLQHVESNKL